MKADMIDKQKLKKLVAGGETPAVISALLKHAKAKGLKELENVLLMMQARLEQNEGEARQGTITREAADTLRNQVNAAILHLLDQDLEKDVDMGQLVSAVNPKPTKRNWWLPLALAGIMVIYIIAKDVMNSKPFGLTVFVHGPEGVEQRLLRSEGKVVLHIGQDQREASINEKGEADFKEIPAKFRGKTARILIDHPQPYQSTHPDSMYLLLPGRPVYLEVSLRNTDRLFGRVFDFDSGNPLAGVTVSIRNVKTLSDENGYFELKIPRDLQAKFQHVAFHKPGYVFSEMDSVPVHTRQELKVALHREQ
jgi:hypothetical protein